MNHRDTTEQNSQENSSPLSMSSDAMQALGNQTLQILLDRRQKLGRQDAWDGDFKDALAQVFGSTPPEQGRDAEAVLNQVAHDILPFTLRLDHPKSFGFIPSEPTWPGVVADLLVSGFNINVATWLTASGPTHIELVVIDWMKNWLDMPATAGGLITSSTSLASVEAFVAAREAAQNPTRPTVYLSDQTHGSLIRALRVVGIAADCIRKIQSTRQFTIDMDQLTKTVLEDIENGCTPVAVVANAGTTSTGAIDPLNQLADFCEQQDIWFHIDAAYGGFACLTDDGAQILSGIGRGDSITLDAHKWFFQPYEAGCLIVKDLNSLESIYGMRSDVLQDTIWGGNHPNIANRGIQLSRAFRALKLWMSVQVFGVQAFREAIETGLTLARSAEQYIHSSPLLESLSPVMLSVVCFRFKPKSTQLEEAELEEINRFILAKIFWDNPAFLSSTVVHNLFSLRICILNFSTTWDDVKDTLAAVEAFGLEKIQSD